MATTSNEPQSKMNDLELDSADPAVAADETLHADPITGEPGAHPAAVGVGALGAGAAGAAIGMIIGPVGAVIGAAVGAVVGGLAGHEAAVSGSETTVAASTSVLDPEATGSTTDEEGRPSSVAPLPEDALMVFPGSDLGAPAVTTEPVDPAAETATEGISFKDAAATHATPGLTGETVTDDGTDFTSSSAGHGFTVGETSEDIVRTAAYYRYLDRLEAGRPGDELCDWVEAEREVTRF